MPKAKSKKKKKKTGKKTAAKKRTVTCGSCKVEGHNARTCPEDKKGKKITSSKDIPAPPIQPGSKTKIDMRHEQTQKRMNTVPERAAPTKDMGSKGSAAPYRCDKCNSVAILVIVRVKDHNESFKQQKDIYKGDMRCEMCMNKPTPSDLILVWGAMPKQTVTIWDATSGRVADA